MKNLKFIEVKSEIGAGTRGASMGVDAIKIAALDYGSNMFKQIESIEIKVENQLLFEHIASIIQRSNLNSINTHARTSGSSSDFRLYLNKF